MAITGSPDIFQEKMTTLMADLEYVHTYIDNILCISKSTFEDHLEKLEKVLIKLRGTDLKCNAPKLLFCAIKI